LQLTPDSSFRSIRGTVLAAGDVPQRWRSAVLGAAEPQVRWTAKAMNGLVPIVIGVVLSIHTPGGAKCAVDGAREKSIERRAMSMGDWLETPGGDPPWPP
jgi:hypothetical protein